MKNIGKFFMVLACFVILPCLVLLSGCETKSFVLTFDVNGGTDVDNMSVDVGADIVLPTTTKEGFTFEGWFESETGGNGSGNRFEATTMPDLGENGLTKTLYAKWSANEYAIVYKDQGDVAYSGNNSNNLPVQHTYNWSTALVAGFKEGYTFNGWFATPECDGEAITTLGAQDYTADITLYAKWSVENYSIHFVTDGSEVADIENVAYGTSISLPTTTKEHYVFVGWFDAQTNGNKIEWTTMPDLGETGATITLYAQWAGEQHTITYKDQGDVDYSGNNASSLALKHTYGTDTALVAGFKEGYTFNGWFATPECDGEAITTLGAQDYTADITLYAKWSVENYSIHFVTDGSEVADIENVAYGTSISLPTTTKEHYVFVGWFDAQTNGNKIEWTTMPDLGGNGVAKSLYAQFFNEEYTITYKDQGDVDYSGNNSDSLPTIHYYGVSTSLASGVKIGCDFAGWFINPECSGEPLTLLGATDCTANIILYAKWEEIFVISGNNITGLTTYGKTLSNLDIPNKINGISVTGIGANAFKNNSVVTAVTIADSISSVGNNAFYNCVNLTSINMPKVTNIGNYAFENCQSLVNVDMKAIKNIGQAAFAFCYNLANVVVPNVSSIGYKAFVGCYGLDYIIMSADITNFSDSWFDQATYVFFVGTLSQASALTYNHGRYYVASYCENTPKGGIYWHKIQWHYNDEGVPTLWAEPNKWEQPDDGEAIRLTTAGKCQHKAIEVPAVRNEIEVKAIYSSGMEIARATSIVIPEGVTFIDKNAFKDCFSLVSVTLPSTLTSIADSAFANCNGLTSVDLPEGVTSLGSGVFYKCNNLTTINIPSDMTVIGNASFYGCNNLVDVIIDSEDIADGLVNQIAPYDDADTPHSTYLVYYATTIYVKEGLEVTDSTYLTEHFATTTTDKIGYVKYVKNS